LTYPLVLVSEPQATQERTTKQYNTATGEAEKNESRRQDNKRKKGKQ
jgi:hypothetical protein